MKKENEQTEGFSSKTILPNRKIYDIFDENMAKARRLYMCILNEANYCFYLTAALADLSTQHPKQFKSMNDFFKKLHTDRNEDRDILEGRIKPLTPEDVQKDLNKKNDIEDLQEISEKKDATEGRR